MTAKQNTRFYVQSPIYGESNEVNLNLEGNCEYEMMARLNQTFSIAVNSNVEGAEVYIDNRFVARTDANHKATISEVTIGNHTLKLVYGNVDYEQQIVVNKNSILFNQNVNVAAAESQFVVFIVEPKSAVVTINNQPYSLTDGAMRVVLDPGTYNYTVAAAGYHAQKGSFTVAGEKVEKSVNLAADSASVTLTAPNNAEIWINGEKVGTGTWRGTLNSGAYIFEARKEGYRNSRLSQRITSATASQSYTLPAPEPVYGSIMVDGTPLTADVALDGKHIGTLPLKLGNILVGDHTLKVSKAGYGDYTQTITVSEGKTTDINLILVKIKSAQAESKLVKKPTYKAKKKVKPHYEQSIELNYQLHAISGSMVHHTGANYIGGYRANRVLFIGAGLGVAYNFDNIDNFSAEVGDPLSTGGINLPLFIHARAYMGAQCRTFAALSVGGTLLGSDRYSLFTGGYKYHTNGIFTDISLGLTINKLYLAAGFSMQTLPTIYRYNTLQMDIKSKIGVGAKISMGFTF